MFLKFEKAEIIVTLGERGSMYAINGQVKIMPALKVGIVDTNGAGAVYGGAFAYGMGRDFGLEKSIAYATIAASLSTTKMTIRGGMPSVSEGEPSRIRIFGFLRKTLAIDRRCFWPPESFTPRSPI